MTPPTRPLVWDGRDLADLLNLDPVTPGSFRSHLADPNTNGRIFGGQLLGQALMAAGRTVAQDRSVTAMQFFFLQGAMHEAPIEIEVATLQEGKRFSTRRVQGSQAAGRQVFEAHVSFAVSLSAPAHAAEPDARMVRDGDPETLPRLSDLPAATLDEVSRAFSYGVVEKRALDFRLPDSKSGLRLTLPQPSLRFWLRTRRELPDDPLLQASAFAYLSDWWINFASLGGHLGDSLQGSRMYITSLNHAVRLHRPFRADEWLHFDCTSPVAGSGRVCTMARVHDRGGQFVASVAQECLMAPEV